MHVKTLCFLVGHSQTCFTEVPLCFIGIPLTCICEVVSSMLFIFSALKWVAAVGEHRCHEILSQAIDPSGQSLSPLMGSSPSGSSCGAANGLMLHSVDPAPKLTSPPS